MPPTPWSPGSQSRRAGLCTGEKPAAPLNLPKLELSRGETLPRDWMGSLGREGAENLLRGRGGQDRRGRGLRGPGRRRSHGWEWTELNWGARALG